MKPTYDDIANNYTLWCEYVDPDQTISDAEFRQMTPDEKIQIQIDIWGAEPPLPAEPAPY
jgi:hypothetical protein